MVKSDKERDLFVLLLRELRRELDVVDGDSVLRPLPPENIEAELRWGDPLLVGVYLAQADDRAVESDVVRDLFVEFVVVVKLGRLVQVGGHERNFFKLHFPDEILGLLLAEMLGAHA